MFSFIQKELKSPVQKLANFRICLSRTHNWNHTVKNGKKCLRQLENKSQKNGLLFHKHDKMMPQTCALLSDTLSVQSVELHCSFLLTETDRKTTHVQENVQIDTLYVRHKMPHAEVHCYEVSRMYNFLRCNDSHTEMLSHGNSFLKFCL